MNTSEIDIQNLNTPRLILRNWKREGRQPFALLNADPRVCEFLPNLITREETLALLDKIQSHFRDFGFGLFAVELRSANKFIGFVGLKYFSFDAHFTPNVELAWRLSWEHWRKGLAFEAARRVTRYGFECLKLPEIPAITTKKNTRS